jgi:hypothetical protein
MSIKIDRLDSQVATRKGSAWLAGLPLLGASASLVVGLLGPAWIYAPANSAANAPAARLDFGDLRQLTGTPGVPTTWLQQSYFDWLGWLSAIVVMLGVAAAILLRTRALALVATGLAVLGLIAKVLALKGPLTWAQVVDQLANLRLGSYLVDLGLIGAAAISLALVSRRPSNAPTYDH